MVGYADRIKITLQRKHFPENFLPALYNFILLTQYTRYNIIFNFHCVATREAGRPWNLPCIMAIWYRGVSGDPELGAQLCRYQPPKWPLKKFMSGVQRVNQTINSFKLYFSVNA